MKDNRLVFVIASAVLLYSITEIDAQQMDTAFTYQGQLELANSAVTDVCEFRFTLWDSAVGGKPIGSMITAELDVAKSLFTVELDFGTDAFTGEGRWLEISVRCPAGVGDFAVLTPRQKVTPTPHALVADLLDGLDSSSFAFASHTHAAQDLVSGILSDALLSNNVALLDTAQTVSGTKTFTSPPSFTDQQSPFAVASQTLVTNLNADRLDGQHGSYYRNASNTDSGILAEAFISAAIARDGEILGIVLANDGPGSGLNADLIDGQNGPFVDLTSSQTIAGAKEFSGLVLKTNSTGNEVVRLDATSNAGFVGVRGPNGNFNAVLTVATSGANNGAVSVRDAAGSDQAGFFVDSSGDGVMFADVKNFRMDHPEEENTEIWYACPEGPEAAAYVRGTGQLHEGRAVVPLPSHFAAVAGDGRITVQVTPLSGESLGLAVTKKTLTEIVVEELQRGNGTYEFDYFVMAVRRGYADYRVVRPSERMESRRSKRRR